MKELKRKRLIHRQQLEDVPELIQHIQSLLPAKDATRTCVLSKSWLHAWSTIPTLRLCQYDRSFTKQQERSYMRLIRRTIRRYHQDNIPIITCDIHFAIHKQSTTRVEKWIKSVASKSCLKELRLKILDNIASFTLPDEIFSSENLNTLTIKRDLQMEFYFWKNHSLRISSNPLIDCVNLRVLELLEVHISEEAFNNLLSTCKLLEKINVKLRFTEDLKKIKVNNLRCLQQLKIAPVTHDFVEIYNVEIYDVSSLRSFYYDTSQLLRGTRVLFKMDSIRSLRELYLIDVDFNDAFSDMIKSKFPVLESLTLKIRYCKVEIMDIRCATLQRLEIESWRRMPFKTQVNAPKLLFFLYKSHYMPSLLFPTVAPEQIELRLILFRPIDHLLVLNIWETLKLSSKFNIEIETHHQVPLKIDYVRRAPFLATNVENLSFKALQNSGFCDNSVLLFDAFFSICQPMYVTANDQLRLKVANYFLKLVKKGVRKNKTGKVYWPHLKYVEIRNGSNGKWEKLTSGTLPLLGYLSKFKLTWSSS